MNIFASFWAGVTQRAQQMSTWAGVALNAVALNWNSIQQQAPAVIQQLAQSHPSAATALNITLTVVGTGLMIWNSTKGKSNGQPA